LTVLHAKARWVCEAIYPWTPQPAWHTPKTNTLHTGYAICPIVVKSCLCETNLLLTIKWEKFRQAQQYIIQLS
jgi:hypothetical protein